MSQWQIATHIFFSVFLSDVTSPTESLAFISVADVRRIQLATSGLDN